MMIKKNQVVKWAVMLWLHGKDKWKYSKGIFKIVREMKMAK